MTTINQVLWYDDVHTMPEELFGAIDIKKALQGLPIPKVDSGHVARKDFVFLDELFQGDSHSEHPFDRGQRGKFHDGSKTIDVSQSASLGRQTSPNRERSSGLF